jgi:hypothetical protein
MKENAALVMRQNTRCVSLNSAVLYEVYGSHRHLVTRQRNNLHLLQAKLTIYPKTGLFFSGKGKGKVHPITGHEGQEGEERYCSTRYGWVVEAMPELL